jgi:CRISPR system Cascade subunit CasD
MPVLVTRLAGPLQSWGVSGRHTDRDTLPYPTYSGLCGLLRAAAGIPRGQPGPDLNGTQMAIRIDAPGQQFTDFHTINPLDSRTVSQIRPRPHSRDPRATIYTESGAPWTIKNRLVSLRTWRDYLAGASFLWLIDGPSDTIHILKRTLEQPVWPVYLGRKACVPEWPYLLGTYPGPLEQALTAIPRVAQDVQDSALECHLFAPHDGWTERTHADRVGSDGQYGFCSRWVGRVRCDHTVPSTHELFAQGAQGWP